MRNRISLFLSALLIFSFVVLPATATEIAEDNSSTVVDGSNMLSYITEKAVLAFPEYENKIRGNVENGISSPWNWNDAGCEVVVSETRAISENEFVGYTECSNGVVVTSLLAYAGKNTYSTVDNGTYTRYELNAWLNVGASSDVLMVEGIKFNIFDDGTNALVSYGEFADDKVYTASSPLRGTTVYSGTTSSPALVDYTAYCTIGISTGVDASPIVTTYHGRLRVQAGSNGPTVTGY